MTWLPEFTRGVWIRHRSQPAEQGGILTRCGWRFSSWKASGENTCSRACFTTALQRKDKVCISAKVPKERRHPASETAHTQGTHAPQNTPVEFWDLRIVFKQRWSLDAWLLLPSIACTVQVLLWRKQFVCTPLKCSWSFFITGFLGWKRGYFFVPPFCWWSITGHLVLSFGSLCLLRCFQKERSRRGALVHEDNLQSEAWLPTECISSCRDHYAPYANHQFRVYNQILWLHLKWGGGGGERHTISVHSSARPPST